MKPQGRLTQPQFWRDRFSMKAEASLSPPSLRALFNLRLYRLFAELLESERANTVLEIGCGYSTWALHLASLGCTYYGIDYLEEGATVARKAVALAGQREDQVVCQDFPTSPMQLPRTDYDLVFSLGFVEHFTDYRSVLKAMWTLVAPGGLLVTQVPNLLGLWGGLTRRFLPDIWRGHVPLSPDELVEAFADEDGVTMIAQFWGTFYPFVVPWDELRLRLGLHRPLVWGLRQLERVSTGVLRACKWQPETRFLSPHVMHVIRKPARVSETP